jgi:hypothetical protein
VEEFDLEAFYAWVEATARERGVLRQDLVRGLKDYYQSLYGYDRYGAETAFLVAERMIVPYVFGFGVQRILADRRVGIGCKIRTAQRALAVSEYGQDQGVPYGLYAAVLFLATHDALTTEDLRYALTLTGYDDRSFQGMDRHAMASFLEVVLGDERMPPAERAFWAHTLVARHHFDTGADAIINVVLGSQVLGPAFRRELAWAWVHQRQPHLDVPIPESGGSPRGLFVAQHLPFWVAHMPSMATYRMMRLGLVWLSRLGEDPEALAEVFLAENGSYVEQFQYAVADILAEHSGALGAERVQRFVEQGLARASSAPVRRKFYSLGSELLGDEYLARASLDPAGSVRQWASRAATRRH